MNIPRQFYGVNYISKLVSNYQDSEQTVFPKTNFSYIDNTEHIPLERHDTLKLGLNAEITCNFLRRLFADRGCGVEGIAIAKGEDVLVNFYKPPYSASTPHITNSTCKTVTAIAVMFALSEKRLSLEDKVVSFFNEYESKAIPKRVRDITVEHLLTMTSCSKTNELISVTEEDWVKAFLLTDCFDEPGSKFIYNSINTYMLGAILNKLTGESLMDYLTPRLFAPLGINDIKWELCPKGLECAGWGLHISLEGMLKLGMFLKNDGSFNGRQLIHPSFIRMMKQADVFQDTDRLSTGYGFQIWHLPDNYGRADNNRKIIIEQDNSNDGSIGNKNISKRASAYGKVYMFSGMYGQHIIIDEKKNMIVAVNAHSDKMFPDSRLTKSILSFINNDNLYKPDNYLKEKLNYGKLIRLVADISTDSAALKDVEFIRRYAAKLDKKRLRIENGSVKLFPYLMQSMYKYPPYHFNEFTISITDDDTVRICFYKVKTKHELLEEIDNTGIMSSIIEKAESITGSNIVKGTENSERDFLDFDFGIGVYHHEMKEFGDDVRPVACKAYMALDEDDRNVLMLAIVFPDAGYSRIIKIFYMDEGRLALESIEYPDIKAIVDQVISGETVLAGTPVDVADKLPESLRVILDQKMEPRMNLAIETFIQDMV